jgi:hypothetical protein
VTIGKARRKTHEKNKKKYIVTDLMNALPGNSSVNKVQHATIDEAVFSMSVSP